MVNTARGEVALVLGRESYILRPTFGAVCAIEDALDTNLYEIGRKLELAEITARELVAFAHACVTQSGYTAEATRLGEAIVEAGTHKTIAALVEFCRSYAFGGREEKKTAEPPPAEPRPTEATTSATI